MTLKSVFGKLVSVIACSPAHGVCDVMIYVAALDGKILPEEIEAYRHLAAKCSGVGAEDIEERLRAALRNAGYLLALATTGVADEAERIRIFVEEALKALPRDFTANLEDVRSAVLLWTSIAIADGDYDGVEMRALKALKERLAETHLCFAATATTGVCALNGNAGLASRLSGVALQDRVTEFLRSDCVAEAKSLLEKAGR